MKPTDQTILQREKSRILPLIVFAVLILLALALVFSSGFGANTAFAAEGDEPLSYTVTKTDGKFYVTEASEGEIGDPEGYDDIRAAITSIRTHAAGQPCTITLGGSGELDEDGYLDLGATDGDANSVFIADDGESVWGTVTIEGKVTAARTGDTRGTVMIRTAAEVILDANIKNTASGVAVYQISTSSGKLTVIGGLISAKSGDAISRHNNQSPFTVNGGTISSTEGRAINNAIGVLHMNGGTVSSVTGVAFYHNAASTIHIFGGTVSSSFGYAVHIAANGGVEVHGGEVISQEGYAAYLSSTLGTSIIRVYGGTVSSNKNTAIYSRYNNVWVYGGTVSSNESHAIYIQGRTSGGRVQGTVQIMEDSNPNTPPVSITNSGDAAVIGGETDGTFVFMRGTIEKMITEGQEVDLIAKAAATTLNFGGTISNYVAEGGLAVTGSVTARLDQAQVYTGSPLTPINFSVPGLIEGTDYDVVYSDNTDAGTATAEIKMKGSAGTGVFRASFEIEKGTAAITTAPEAKTLAYTGAAQELITAGVASIGEVVYCLTEEGEYTTTIPTGINAGSYPVYYKVVGNDNYDGIDAASVTVTIAKASGQSVAVSGSAGSEKTADSITVAAVTPPTTGQTIEYSIDGGATWQDSTTFSGLTAGTEYTIIARAKANDNYSASESSIVLTVTTSAADGYGDGSGGLGAGAIAGIVIGSVAAAGLIGFSIFWFLIKKRKLSDLFRRKDKN